MPMAAIVAIVVSMRINVFTLEISTDGYCTGWGYFR